ncbi:MAG: CDP-glycerol glycerophosphotransferase family protein [Vicinamibacterales bacterium]
MGKIALVARIAAKLSLHALLGVLVPLVSWVPRDPNLWAFGTLNGRGFAENTKWLYLHCQQVGGVRAIWISRDRTLVEWLRAQGLPAKWLYSLAGMWVCVRAGVYLYNWYVSDVCFWLSRGALKVNLWHGIPLKRIQWDSVKTQDIEYRMRYGSWLSRTLARAVSPGRVTAPHLITATSHEVAAILAKAFSVPSDRVAITGLPRTEGLVRTSPTLNEAEAAALVRIEATRREGGWVAAYVPTFRSEAITSSFVSAPFRMLDAAARSSGGLLVVKPHLNTDWSPGEVGVCQNIVCVPREADLYTFLGGVDLLLTDYSSVFFDFLLLDRPIVFMCEDLEEYQSRERQFYFDYETTTPGRRVNTWEQVAEIFRTLKVPVRDEYEGARRALRTRMFEQPAEGAAERVRREVVVRSARCFRAPEQQL